MQKLRGHGNQPMSSNEIDENLIRSFPASDPPFWSLGTDHLAKTVEVKTLETARPDRDAFSLSRAVNDDDHTLGDESAAVTLLMYGAYECPFCVEGNEIVKRIRNHFGERLRFVFRHFPRTSVHPHAEAAAEVAEAAGEQYRFWEMHDKLFENYNRLDGGHLVSYAESLGLDMERFERAITGRVFAGRVRADLISGIESGVKGTPTYFINGEKHSGSGQFKPLIEAIENRIAFREAKP